MIEMKTDIGKSFGTLEQFLYIAVRHEFREALQSAANKLSDVVSKIDDAMVMELGMIDVGKIDNSMPVTSFELEIKQLVSDVMASPRTEHVLIGEMLKLSRRVIGPHL